MARSLMILGTSSSVGKSILVTALCRIFLRRGFNVAPFKAQNMSLNSFVTPQGHEIGRAQAVQAEAAGIPPEADMNPILLKPEADARSQVVLMGKPWRTLPAKDYYPCRDELWKFVVESLERLDRRYDLIIAEGAGSPVEINLQQNDVVNMRVADHLKAPVILVGDIDRGGIFAQLLGTLWLLEPQHRALVRGLVVNKFRGDPDLFKDGNDILEARGGVPVLGIIPYLDNLGIAQEDSVYLDDHRTLGDGKLVDIVVLNLPYMSNYDDFDALATETGVQVRFIQSVGELGDPDALILPGSKTTLADLKWLRSRNFDRALTDIIERGKSVVGICGGYQMLGRNVRDISGVEGHGGEMTGFDLLPMRTDFSSEKSTHQVRGRVIGGSGFLANLKGVEVTGYEIHMGHSDLLSGSHPLLMITDRGGGFANIQDGCSSNEGRIWGTYLHGIFDNPGFRRAWLRSLGWEETGAGKALSMMREEAYDRLADHVEEHLNIALIEEMIDQ
jgi:adenosylcobyric acid synthase